MDNFETQMVETYGVRGYIAWNIHSQLVSKAISNGEALNITRSQELALEASQSTDKLLELLLEKK